MTHDTQNDTQQDEMVEKMSDALSAKIREAADNFPGSDEQRRAILRRTTEKLQDEG